MSYQLKFEIMAIYKVTSETVNLISVNGKSVQQNIVRTHRVIDGNMDDVARVMYKKQLNFLVLNTIDRATEDVKTIFTSKDNVNHIKEMGYCVTQLCNKLGDGVSNMLTLTQTAERIG
jgi:hypothetical protein